MQPQNFKKMTTRRIALQLILMLTATTALAQTKPYKGAWFSVRYPASFKAKGEYPSKTMGSGFDAATFTSPDASCTFYVFAPKGDTPEADKIMQTNEETPTSKGKDGDVVTFSSFYSPKLKRTCSYRMVRNPEQLTVYIIGIRFTSYDVFKKYARAYEAFKKSLQLYND